MVELLKFLSTADNRKTVQAILDLYSELSEIRKVARKLQGENGKLMNNVLELKKDKQAMSVFIEDNVTDTELLKLIFRDERGQ